MAAINIRCLEGIDLDSIPVQHFDGRALRRAAVVAHRLVGELEVFLQRVDDADQGIEEESGGGIRRGVRRRIDHGFQPSCSTVTHHPPGIHSTLAFRSRRAADFIARPDGLPGLAAPATLAEGVPGGYAGVYPVLRAMEEAGRIRRGYFAAGVAATQFAMPAALTCLVVHFAINLGAVQRIEQFAEQLEL